MSYIYRLIHLGSNNLMASYDTTHDYTWILVLIINIELEDRRLLIFTLKYTVQLILYSLILNYRMVRRCHNHG